MGKARKLLLTRKSSTDLLVGPSSDLPEADLPTLRNVLSKAKQIKESRSFISQADLANDITKQVKTLYRQVNSQITFIQDRAIKTKFAREWKVETLQIS